MVMKGKQMRINQTTFLALRAIYRIHLERDDVVTSKTMAQKEEVSQGVLIKTLRILNSTGILSSHQGRGLICGGFSLNKSIDEITLLEIIDAMEGIDICSGLSLDLRTKEKRLYHQCKSINNCFREEFSRYTIRDLFNA